MPLPPATGEAQSTGSTATDDSDAFAVALRAHPEIGRAAQLGLRSETLKTADLDGIEPFGFTDGISQPQIDWARQRDPTRPQIDYTNVVALGEFLLGYPNEYNKYTERPLLDPDPATANLLPAEDEPEKKELGRNGTYLVMRDLQQDVRAFWQFVSQQTAGNVATGEKLAAAMVGRTRAGDPLVPIQS